MYPEEHILFEKWACHGDAEAFRVLCSKYSGLVYGACLRVLRDESAAEEVAQECFEALAALKRGPKEHLGAWLHKVATYRAKNRVRSETRRDARERRFAMERSAETEISWDDIYEHVDEAIAELPDKLRTAIVAHFLEGRTHEAIAQKEGVSRSAVTHRIERGLDAVRKSLMRRGIPLGSAVLAGLMSANLAKAEGVPASLTVALGKLAVSGAAVAAGPGNASTAVTSAATAAVIMKKAVVGLVLVAVAGGGLWALPRVWERRVEAGTTSLLQDTSFLHSAQAPSAPDTVAHDTAPRSELRRPAFMPTGDDRAYAGLRTRANREIPCEVSGEVLRKGDNTPIPGARVRIFRRRLDEITAEVSTDGDGRFVFTELQSGRYFIRADAAPGVFSKAYPVSVEGRSDREELRKQHIQLEVDLGWVITGRVYEKETGSGIVGALISLDRQESREFWTSGGQTDASGFYRLEGYEEAHVKLRLNSIDGYSTRSLRQSSLEPRRMTVGPGIVFDGIDFPVLRGVAVSGFVTNMAGVPASRVKVSGRQFERDIECGALTAEDGSFEMLGFVPGIPVHFWASTDKMCSAMTGSLAVSPEGIRNVALVLDQPRNASISGTVVDASGQGLAGVSVHAWNRDHDFSIQEMARTDENGQFKMARLLPGRHRLIAVPRANWADPGQVVEIQLEQGEHIQGLTLTIFEELLAISGRVTDVQGNPVARASVHAYGKGSSGTFTNSDGVFRIEGLREGTYLTRVECRGYSPLTLEDVPAGSTGVDFVLPSAGTAEGVVISAASGAPITDFEIASVEGRKPLGWPATEREFYAVTDPDGRFSLGGLVVGDNTIIARAPGYAPAFEVVSYSGVGESLSPIVIALEGSTPFLGSVVDPNGAPVSDALVFTDFLPYRPSSSSELASARTAADGSFRLDWLLPTNTMVIVYKEGYAPAWSPLAAHGRGASSATLVLHRGGSVAGRVTCDGRPLAGEAVKIEFEANRKLYQTSGGTRSDGSYSFQNVPSGEVALMMELRDAEGFTRRAKQYALVEEGRRTDVNFDFAPCVATLSGTVTLHGVAASSSCVGVTRDLPAGEEWFHADSQSDGSYRFGNLPAGPAKIRVAAKDRSGAISEKVFLVELPAGEDTRLDFDI